MGSISSWQLHTSFISDLLDRSETLRLRRAFELLMPELEGHSPNEKAFGRREPGAKRLFAVSDLIYDI